MKNYRFYIYTLLILVGFSIVASIIGVGYLSKNHTIQVLGNEIQSAEQQVKKIAVLAEKGFENKESKEEIASNIQKTLGNIESQNVFFSVFNWSSKIISHPDVTQKQGTQDQNSGMTINMQAAPTSEELYDFIQSKERAGVNQSEIFYTAPIKNPDSDWIIAAHLNISNIDRAAKKWENQAYLIFSIIMLLVMIIVMVTIRMITSFYETQLSLKSSKIEDGVLNLSKLNDSLENYQNKLGEFATMRSNNDSPQVESTKEKEKQRILTYVRNELMPVSTEDIGYIYVENTITYVVQKDGKRSTTSESLDQIYSYLDEKSFFRANRQIIVAISAIDKIIKFGNSKLKIQVVPASEIDIIIGKNKAAAFKQWLDL